MVRRTLPLLALLLGPSLGIAADSSAANWPCWRGPAQDGHSSDTRVPLKWSASENLKWQVDLPGFGNSSPIVWGDRIFLTSATKDGNERWVLCLDRKHGKMLWQKSVGKGFPPEKTHNWNTHASATCVTDGERVYAFFGNPGVYCFDLDGKQLWQQSIGKLGCATGWGISGASPVLCDDLLIINGDHGGLGSQKDERGSDFGPSYLWAFNKQTGEIVWKTPRNQGMGWSTPLVLDVKGRREIIINSPHGVWSYEPKTGKELWHATGRGKEELFGEIAPVWDREQLYAFTGRPGPAMAIRLGGNGDVSDSHVTWKIRRGDRDVSSPILVDGIIYQIDRKGVLVCFDAKTGERVWSQRLGGEPCASFLYVRGKVMILDDTGKATLFEPGRQFKLVQTNKLGDSDVFRASPAIVDGQLLIRSDRRLYCVAEK